MSHSSRGFVSILTVALVVVVGFIAVGGIKKWNYTSVPRSDQTLIPVQESNSSPGNSMQLKTIAFTTLVPTPTIPPGVTVTPTPTVVDPSPTRPSNPGGKVPGPRPPTNPDPQPTSPPPPPGNYCTPNSPKVACECQYATKEVLRCTSPSVCDCTNKPVQDCPKPFPGYCTFRQDQAGFNQYRSDPSCQAWCIDKPVIYLYPQYPTLVDVKLRIPGHVTVSIPTYPENTGWQDVLAYPDGTLVYQNKSYTDLYYETSVTHKAIPHYGIFIPKSQLSLQLPSLLSRYGLNEKESKEFMDYWMPRLQEVPNNYIFFSVFNKQQKDEIDHVTIQPKPDVFIEVLVYFKGVDFPFATGSLTIPSSPPQRYGFTAVEWGGILD